MTNPPRKSRTLLVAGTLIALSLAALAAVPTASAHSCSGTDPATSCGECTSGYHRHSYSSGGSYCSSDGEEDPPVQECKVLGITMPKVVCSGIIEIRRPSLEILE